LIRNKINGIEIQYLKAYPDVARAVTSNQFSSGLEHFYKFGKKEGRLLITDSAPTVARRQKVFSLLNVNGLGLEIGPSHRPLAPKKDGFNVHIIDHASAKDLRNKYKGSGVNIDNIEEVDFVWHGESYSDLIGKKACYDYIISSHVIEHIPDLISHIQQCKYLLKPNGFLSLVIPDKRYCFDYFCQLSSTGDLLDAYSERRVRPTHGQVFNHIANASKRKGVGAWTNDDLGGADELIHTFSQAKSLWSRSIGATEYIDVHCWRFVPASFALIISDLNNLGVIGMEIKIDFDTTGCEFYVTLGHSDGIYINQDRFSILSSLRI
jgi:predicted SAM-dependent methyltransferase